MPHVQIETQHSAYYRLNENQYKMHFESQNRLGGKKWKFSCYRISLLIFSIFIDRVIEEGSLMPSAPSVCPSVFRPNRPGTRKIWRHEFVRPSAVRRPSGGKLPNCHRSSVENRRFLSTCSRPRISLSRSTDRLADAYCTLPAFIDRRLSFDPVSFFHSVIFFNSEVALL